MKHPSENNCKTHDDCEMVIKPRVFRDGSTHYEMRCREHDAWIKWLSHEDYASIRNDDVLMPTPHDRLLMRDKGMQ